MLRGSLRCSRYERPRSKGGVAPVVGHLAAQLAQDDGQKLGHVGHHVVPQLPRHLCQSTCRDATA